MKMRQLVTILSFFILFAFVGCGHADIRQPASTHGHRYSLRGLHPTLGSYSGELEVRGQGDHVTVTRLVTYDQFRFEGLKVQEIWQAQGALQNARLHVVFQLKQADIFNKVDSLLRSPEDFSEPIHVIYDGDPARGLTEIQTPETSYYDQIFDQSESTDSTPPWRDQREKIASRVLVPSSANKNFERALRELKADPFYRKYQDRKEFKTKTQYFIFDPTDFEFLRSHPDTVRVVNKKMDTISLVESALRRDAYAPTLAEKVRRFDVETEENYLNEFGLYSGAHFDSAGEHAGHFPNNDSVLWSGLYAGAQAMRWRVTQEPKALELFKKTLRGLMLALDAPVEEGQFARTVHPLAKSDELMPPWRRCRETFKNCQYLDGGDAPLLLGMLYGFAWSYEILPEQDPLLKEISDHVNRLTKLRLLSDESLSLAVKGLVTLASGTEASHQDYARAFQKQKTNVTETDWNGANLKAVADMTKIILAHNILKKFKGSAGDRKILKESRQALLRTWSTYAASRRGLITAAAQAFGVNDSPMGFDPQTSPRHWAQQNKWNRDLEQAVWILREVPLIRTPHSLHYDFSMRPDWSLSGLSQLPPKDWQTDTHYSRFYQGAYDFPIFESKAAGTDNYWASAFGFRSGASSAHRFGRVDYLVVYWMTRFGGVVGPTE